MSFRKVLSFYRRLQAFKRHPHKNMVFIDTTNVCNARCYFCPTGIANRNHTANHAKFMDVALFEKILRYLKAQSFLTPGTQLVPYIWYEPTLHPNFSDIIATATREGCFIDMSTNAAHFPKLASDFDASAISVFHFSMCGFSRTSYDKIHQLDFEQVKRNITTWVKTLRNRNCCGRLVIRYHIYQFNIHEIPAAYDFAKSLNIALEPYCAFLINYKQWAQFLKNELPMPELTRITKDLLTNYTYEPTNECDWFRNSLVINADGNVMPCCNIQDPIGNVFDCTQQNLYEWHQKVPFCKECMALGLPNAEMKYPNFYQPPYAWRPRWYWEILKTCFR